MVVVVPALKIENWCKDVIAQIILGEVAIGSHSNYRAFHFGVNLQPTNHDNLKFRLLIITLTTTTSLAPVRGCCPHYEQEIQITRLQRPGRFKRLVILLFRLRQPLQCVPDFPVHLVLYHRIPRLIHRLRPEPRGIVAQFGQERQYDKGKGY